jgi:hypothetical protein
VAETGVDQYEVTDETDTWTTQSIDGEPVVTLQDTAYRIEKRRDGKLEFVQSIRGDLNDDGMVDAADSEQLANHLGAADFTQTALK